MKILFRPLALIVSALVLALIAPGVAAQAAAPPKNPPGIKATKQYKALKTYVGELRVKRNTRTTEARKAVMRNTLANRRANAASKVSYLYNQRLRFIAYQANKQLNAKLDRIDKQLTKQLTQLNNELDTKVGNLQRAQKNALATTRAKYANQIEDLVAQRKALRKKLAKTTNPAKRTALMNQINAIQTQINNLNTAKQDAINNIVANYGDKIDFVQTRYARLIRNAKADARDATTAARAQVKARQDSRNAGARTRRTGEGNQVKALYDQGVAYINMMPVPTPPAG